MPAAHIFGFGALFLKHTLFFVDCPTSVRVFVLGEQVQIPVPADVTKRRTRLELDPSRMKLSFKNVPEFKPLEGKFKGLMSPMDSVWMIGEHDRRIYITPPLLYLRNHI